MTADSQPGPAPCRASADITVNTRALAYRITGVQRYARELLARFPSPVTTVCPRRFTGGIPGHAWEQFALPALLRPGSLLWSPSLTGPLAVDRQVVTLHDTGPLDHPEWFRPVFGAWYRFVLPHLARRVRRVIAISEFTKRRIVDTCGIDPDRISVVLNGVDRRFNPQARDETAIAALRLPTPRYLLAVGSIEPRKNIPALIRAWGRIAARIGDDLSLVIAGGMGKSSIFSAVDLGTPPPRVHFTGHVPDPALPALYAGATAFCYPSLYEGFGIPPLEAMAAGTPVLTGNRTSLPEVVADAGLMVDPGSEEAIADGLLRLCTDEALRTELRRRGLERARRFTWDEAARQTWQVLCEAAS
jgi:glycosyltransferase involved in cell wall biosynthesis